jgi:DNA-binding transcriptional MerR regulator
MSNMSHHDHGGGIVGTAEAADLIGVSVRTIHRCVAKGNLHPITKLGGLRGAYLFHAADVLALRTERAA